jgi:gliding motility-associated-like protein
VATIPGFENKYVEGKLNRAMLPDSTYSFPVAINPENEVFGAQIAEISPKGNVRGNALVSFTRDRGVAKNLTFEDTSCQFSVKSVLDHGWWNVDSINALASYNLRLKGDNVVNTYVNNDKSKFTIVNKNNGTDNSAYTGGIAGIDPTCGNSLYTDVYRTGLSKSSDFAIASLIDVEKFEIPNYISPNGDGSNDFFDLSALRNIIPNLRLMIYNRWGNLVYRSVGPYKNNWGGEHMLDELPLPDGVYYYLITDSEELKKTITGFVEVMRN